MANNVDDVELAFQSLGFTERPNSSISCRLQIQSLLNHFNKEIRSIIRDVLRRTDDADQVLWRVAEECYNQTSDPSGALHADDALILRLEETPKQPRDPNVESDEYPIPEECIGADETDVHNRHQSIEPTQATLHGSPGGPTLFYPSANKALEVSSSDFSDVPQYLFRTFDGESQGLNTESVIASMATAEEPSTGYRTDLLSLDKLEATENLFLHLTKELMNPLMPGWYHGQARYCSRYNTQSLDVAEMGVHRRRKTSRDPEFMKASRGRGEGAEELFNFRSGDTRYYNGVYLSQGSLNLSGRSCVVSLETLISAGLFKLYTEFAETSGGNLWANRARNLRWLWQGEQTTSHREIEQACEIAERCFPGFEASHLALILLAFKSRKPAPTMPATTIAELNTANQPTSERDPRPVEVRGYTVMARALQLINQPRVGEIQGEPVNSVVEAVKGLFECTE
ncbi:hypothetical protein F5X97DRAFT_323851 [Nemania serpens]|nr:hypothetical protein F5X97DRAFT_323851 [Nemania serpens]